MNKQKSFTLIELLVVIVIIGILAGVIMISTSSSIDKANIAKVKVFEESITNSLAANMVSRWPLNEITGTAAPYKTPDAWGSNHGTLNGVNGLPQLRPASECITDSCFKFDGVDDYIDCGNDLKIGSGDFTVSIWAKSNGFINGAGIIGKKSWYQYNGPGFFIAYPGSPQNIYVGVTNTANQRSVIILNDLKAVFNWSQIVLVRFGSRINVYLNGKFIDYASAPDDYSNDSPLMIGKNEYTHNVFNGLIDDAKLYNAALSSSQIKQNYIAGLNSMLANGNISKQEYNERINNLAYNDNNE